MGTQLPPEAAQPPNFQPMSIVAKLLPISATAEHLFTLMSAVFTRATLAIADISCRRVSACLSVRPFVRLSQVSVLLK